MGNIEEFLKELYKLSNKYGFVIDGCGCCGSPFLRDITTGNAVKWDLEYDEEKETYVVYD